MSTIYPWQRHQWSLLSGAWRQGRFPHALMLSGMSGMGKGRFASALAQALLCRYRDSEEFACGRCTACRQFESGVHPDFLRVVPEQEGKPIKVDRVRGVGEFLTLKSYDEGGRVVLLAPAEAMNSAAANSLLKILEEPVLGTVLILVTSRPGMLLATIRSRCQQIGFPPPQRAVARQWLQEQPAANHDAELLLELSAGAPLRALQLVAEGVLEQRLELFELFEQIVEGRADPVAVAEQWSQQKRVSEVLFWIDSWLMDMIRLTCSRQPPLLANRDLAERLLRLGRPAGSKRLLALRERVVKAARYLHGSLNPQLLLEDLLISLSALARHGNTSY